MRHLLAIDDLSDDLPRILEWAIAYKSLWTSGDELALNFLPLDLAPSDRSTRSHPHGRGSRSRWASPDLVDNL